VDYYAMKKPLETGKVILQESEQNLKSNIQIHTALFYMTQQEAENQVYYQHQKDRSGLCDISIRLLEQRPQQFIQPYVSIENQNQNNIDQDRKKRITTCLSENKCRFNAAVFSHL
jgi:hypothetical protein